MNWRKIVVHHSATEDSDADNWSAIKRYHMEHNGWNDIGYHFGVEKYNRKYVWRIGRPLTMEGAHTKGQNKTAIGVCVVGNFDKEPPPEEAIRVLVENLIPLCWQFNIDPLSGIDPHNKYANKTCPGRLFPLQEVRERVKRGM